MATPSYNFKEREGSGIGLQRVCGASAWLNCHQDKMGEGRKAMTHNCEDTAEMAGNTENTRCGGEDSKLFKISRQL